MYNVLFLLLWALIWYWTGEATIYNQRKKLICRAWKITQLEAIKERYEQYVPKTEKKKNEIVKLHFWWFNGREIWRILWIDGSAINRALHRWNIK